MRTADFNMKFQNMKDSESRYESNSAGRTYNNHAKDKEKRMHTDQSTTQNNDIQSKNYFQSLRVSDSEITSPHKTRMALASQMDTDNQSSSPFEQNNDIQKENIAATPYYSLMINTQKC